MSPFESPKLLLARARSHIAEFEAVERSFVEQKPYVQFSEKDAKTGDTLFKARIEQDLPSLLPVIVFEVVNGLRSSLDHAVYDSCVALTGHASPKHTKFPFGQTETQARSDLERKQSEVPVAIRPFLLAFKPFDPSNGGNPVLYGLNEIRNGKVHRTLSEMAVANQGIGFGNGLIGELSMSRYVPDWNGDTKELTYLRATNAEQVTTPMHIYVFVAFSNFSPFPSKNAIATLNELCGLAEDIVSEIEAETQRLRALTL